LKHGEEETGQGRWQAEAPKGAGRWDDHEAHPWKYAWAMPALTRIHYAITA